MVAKIIIQYSIIQGSVNLITVEYRVFMCFYVAEKIPLAITHNVLHMHYLQSLYDIPPGRYNS